MGYKVNVHMSCGCNEMVSLHNRHLIDRQYLKCDISYIKKGFRKLASLIGDYRSFSRISRLDVVNLYTGGKKKQYYSAYLALERRGLQRKDTFLKMFVKPDRWPEDVIKEKAPRAIQFRAKEFNIELARYLHKVEHDLYARISWNGSRVVAKGLTTRQRAELWQEKCRAYKRPLFINLDHSKFDSTVNMQHLKSLHSVYRRICGKGIQNLLKYQYNNVGWTKSGVKYAVKGTRMSGDYDTALGNTLINIACIVQCLAGIKFDFMLDGDDAIIVMERHYRSMVNIGNFEKFGFETKLEFNLDPMQVEFCQSRLVWTEGWNFIRNPIRAISNNTVVLKKYNMKWMARYVAGVGVGELSVSAGAPILQQQAVRLMKCSDNPYLDADEAWRMSALGVSREPTPVTSRARTTMAQSWGISPALQVAVEHMLSPMTLAYVLKRIHYDYESLFESWAKLAAVGCSCFAGRWQFSRSGL